jgi:hypothetical protein
MPSRTQSRYGAYGESGKKAQNPATEANPELIGELVQAVLAVGDAVLFGITRDGGAVRTILMSGDDKTSVYHASGAELDAFAKQVAIDLRKLAP